MPAHLVLKSVILLECFLALLDKTVIRSFSRIAIFSVSVALFTAQSLIRSQILSCCFVVKQ